MDWYRHIHKRDSGVDKTDKYRHLLDFLLVKRDALEYGSSDLKYTSKQVAIHTEQNTDIPSCLIHAGCTHSTNDCRQYTKMSIDEKYALLKSSNSCFGCLAPNHQLKECPCRESCAIDECQKYHNKSLHDKHHSGLSHAVITSKDVSESICLLPIMKVRVVSPYGQFLNTLWDSGASITLVTNSKASALKLFGKPVQLSVIKVGGCEETISSKLYEVPIMAESGKRVYIRAYGIEKTTNDISCIKLNRVIQLFKDITLADVERPSGEIDLLIGYDYAALHPVRQQRSDNLLLLTNNFGKCIVGSHPKIIENTRSYIV